MANILLVFKQGQIGSKFVTDKFHHILHCKPKNLLPALHSACSRKSERLSKTQRLDR